MAEQVENPYPVVLRAIALTFAVGVVAACGPPAESETILRHCDGDPEHTARELTLTEEWTVGGTGDTALSLTPPLMFPTPAPMGGLSLAQAFEAPVITLDPDGAVRSRIGRSGSGPGEWGPTSTAGIAWYGDTLWVVQFRPARVHQFSEAGELIETRQILPGLDEPVSPLHVLRNGALLVVSSAGRAPRPRRLFRWVEGSIEADSLGLFQADLTYRVDWPGGGATVAARPVGDHLLEAVAPDGRSVVLVNRSASKRANSAEFRIQRIGDDGRALLDLAVCYRPIPISEKERSDTIAAQVDRLTAYQSGVAPGLAREVIQEALVLPEFWPPITQVVVTSTDEIWLRREVREDGSAPWELRDREGRLTGVMRLPSDVKVLAVDEEVVWTERMDPWDVPRITRNRLVSLQGAVRSAP